MRVGVGHGHRAAYIPHPLVNSLIWEVVVKSLVASAFNSLKLRIRPSAEARGAEVKIGADRLAVFFPPLPGSPSPPGIVWAKPSSDEQP